MCSKDKIFIDEICLFTEEDFKRLNGLKGRGIAVIGSGRDIGKSFMYHPDFWAVAMADNAGIKISNYLNRAQAIHLLREENNLKELVAKYKPAVIEKEFYPVEKIGPMKHFSEEYKARRKRRNRMASNSRKNNR